MRYNCFPQEQFVNLWGVLCVTVIGECYCYRMGGGQRCETYCNRWDHPTSCPLLKYLNEYLCSVGLSHTAVQVVDCRIFESIIDMDLLSMLSP